MSGIIPFFLCLAEGNADAPYVGGSLKDYERAQNLRSRFSGKVYRDHIEAQWMEGDAYFWYRVVTGPGTHEYILVDAENSVRHKAFDHVRVADNLAAAGLENISADTLPLDNIEFVWKKQSLEYIYLVIEGQRWRCDPHTYALKYVDEIEEESLPPFSPGDAPEYSSRTGAETRLLFINRTEKEVEIFWLDARGNRQSYGKIQPGKRHQQHTYAGHVWLVADSEDKTIAVYEAITRHARVLIGIDFPQNEGRHAVRTEPPRRRERADSSISPDGQWRAFIRDHNVWLRERQGDNRQEFPLSSDGKATDSYMARFYWSPDSRKLAVVRRQPEEERRMYYIESSPKDQLQPKLHSTRYLKPGDRVAIDKPQLFDIESRKQIAISDHLFSNPYNITGLRWQPDSRRLTFVYNQRGHQVLRVVAVDAGTGETEAVIEENSETFINYSGKLFLEYIDESGEMIWMSERDGWNHLYLYDAATAEVKNQITSGSWVVRGVDHVDKENRQIWIRVGGVYPEQDPYYVHHARVNFDGSDFTLLTASNGTHRVQYSPERRFLLASWSRVDHPPVHELRSSEDGSLIVLLEEANPAALHEAGWRAPEPFVAKGRDGETDIYGIIIRPTDFDPQRLYPVIENIYAGPQGAFVPKDFRAYYKMMELAELGFIVVQIDGMGTSHRSKAFHDVCWQNLADAGLPDRVRWIRAAAEVYTYMDTDRVGIYGGSAGGQNAAAAVFTHGDFYKVAVADCGCHDNRMDKMWWNEQWMGWPVGPHYEANSNVTLAPGLEGKLLLIVGELDTNVDPASTMQVVDALIRADKDFELLVMTGTGHGAAETPYGSRRRADFFVRHMFGVEPRHNAQ